MILNPTNSRIEMDCGVLGKRFLVWVDTGSPNTLVHADFAKRLGIPHIIGKTFNGKVAGKEFRKRPAVTIPELSVLGCHPLKNIRAITALEGDEWREIIILGLNVLNHLVYKIDRSPLPGTFEWLESLTSKVPNSMRTRFDHLIIGNDYLLTEEDEAL